MISVIALGGCGSNGERVEPPGDAASASEQSSEAPQAGPARPDLLTREDYLAYLAEDYGIVDPPVVEPVREVRPEEVGAVMVECMAEFGFAVTVDESGGWGAAYPTAQQAAFDLAGFTCEARFPLQPVFWQPWDDATLERVYAHLTDVVQPCFADRGYPFELPSFATFVDRYRADRSFTSGSPDAPDSVFHDCDANIPSSVIAGD